MHLKLSSAKWRQFCFGLNVLIKGGFQVDGRSDHSLGHVLKLEENLELKLDVIIYTCWDLN